MSLRRPVLAAVLAAALSLPSVVCASPFVLQPGEYHSSLTGSVFSSHTWLDADGGRAQLDATLEERTLVSRTEFGWRKGASLWLELPMVSRTWVDSGDDVTSTGLGELGFGTRIALRKGTSPVALSLGWTAPLGTNRRLVPGTTGGTAFDGASFGDTPAGAAFPNAFWDAGLQSLSASLAFGVRLGSRAALRLESGYRTRFLTIGARDSADRYADHLLLGAELDVRLGERLLLTGAYRTENVLDQSAAYDRVLTPGAAERESERSTFAPRLTYRVDDRMDVVAGSEHTIGGAWTPHENRFHFGLVWRSSGAPAAKKTN